MHRRIVAVKEFDGFLHGRQVDGPALADHAAGVRALMLDFLGHLRARQVTRDAVPGSGCRRPRCSAWPAISSSSTCSWPTTSARRPPRWPNRAGYGSGPQHAGFYRRGELPGKQQPRLEARSSTMTP